MDKQLRIYLSGIRDDIFKLLPMREAQLQGEENYLDDYIETLIMNIKGGMLTFPLLGQNKYYLYIINSLQYIAQNNVTLKKWRKVILDSVHDIDIVLSRTIEVNDNEH